MTKRPETDDDIVEDILGRWFDLQLAGEAPDLDELCAEAPHLRERVRGLLERQQELIGPAPAESQERDRPSGRPAVGPLPMDRLGGFELKSRIGSGGMGDVYLAREVELDRIVALKVLRREFCDDPLRRLRFRREAQLTAALDHPDIVPIYGTGEDAGHVFLVMKHLPGTTLDRAIGLAPRRLARIGARVAHALHAAHEVGIVHRDVKPGNVQVDGLDADGRSDDVWVLDFGLARGRVDLTLTTEGQAPGTMAYMPPEQLRGDSSGVDPRCDIYSLGATLYQCIAGRPPFDGDRPEQIVRRALLHEPAPLELAPVDRDLATIIMRALEKDPGRRFASAAEFAADLERYVAGEPIHSRPPSTLTRFVKLARRHRVVASALAAALLVAVVLVPQLVANAWQRAAELDRRFEFVETTLAGGLPAVAFGRLLELESSAAAEDARFGALQSEARATLARDALLDRILLDAVHFTVPADGEFVAAMADLPDNVRGQELTAVALAFLEYGQGNLGRATEELGRLAGTGAMPRFVAVFEALLGGRDPVAAIANTDVGAMPVEDHVFAAAVLRNADASSGAMEAEIRAAFELDPASPRARLMVAVWHIVQGEAARARETLLMLWDDRRPRPELHCEIASLALIDYETRLAAEQIERAESALLATGRRPAQNAPLARVRIRLHTKRGEFDQAVALLAATRERLGDDEWLHGCDVEIALGQEDWGAARQRALRMAAVAKAPWNRRRAEAVLLQIAVATWGEAPDEESGRALVERARDLADSADKAGHRWAGAIAQLAIFDVGKKMAGELLVADPAEALRWEHEYWRALLAAFEFDDGNAGATIEAGIYLLDRLADRERDPAAELWLGDTVRQARQRAVRLSESAYRGERTIEFADHLLLAVLGARLSAEVEDDAAAKRAGAIAAALLGRPGVEVDPQITSILDQAREKLGLTKWPAPADHR